MQDALGLCQQETAARINSLFHQTEGANRSAVERGTYRGSVSSKGGVPATEMLFDCVNLSLPAGRE